MSGPFAEGGIVMKFETGSPTEFIQFDPSHLSHDQWLHRRDDLDLEADRSTLAEEYVLPESDTYEVRIIEVPEGETLQMGAIGEAAGRSGGADLVHLLSRESIPDAWLKDVTTLAELRR